MTDPRTTRRRRILRLVATGAVVLVALCSGALVWHYYVSAPWTRNGQVRVQVSSIAPQVTGQIVELRVVDNQMVKKGDVLYVIDDFDYKAALDTAKAELENRAADLQVKRAQSARRQALSSDAVSAEQQQQFAGSARMAEAAYATAQVQLTQAEMNLKRTQVLSPVNGYVTNLLMRAGDFAAAGTRNISVVDSDSYWIDGYFEETKMAGIQVGDRARVDLMGYSAPIHGRVDSVTRGIATSNAAPSTQGLPDVNPVYTWVRLAQRVPVRIAILRVPEGVPLVAGMTATVSVEGAAAQGVGWSPTALVANLRSLFGGQRLTPSDAETTRIEGAATVDTLPPTRVTPPPAPDAIAPPLPMKPGTPPPRASAVPDLERSAGSGGAKP